jgi:signal transduction histidine kinase
MGGASGTRNDGEAYRGTEPEVWHPRDTAAHLQAARMHRERMATLGWLAASVGHDLRTPLAGIRANSELALGALDRVARALGGAPEPSLVREIATLAELERTNLQAVDRLNEIIAGLMAFAGNNGATPRRAAVATAVDHSLLLCARELHHVRLVRCVAPDLPEVAARPAELMQVLVNLLVNAAHALPPGGTVELVAQAWTPVRVAVMVADDGPGLAPEVRARLFRPGVTTKAARGGTGLGLSIVKRIVQDNGGTLEVDTTPGQGARFRILLPHATSPCA